MKRLLYILLIFSQLLNAQVLTNLSGDIILSGGNIMRDKKVVEFYSQQSGAIDQITFTFIIDAGKTLNVDWGNGVVSSLTGTGSNQNISSSYIYSNNTYSIRIYGDLDNVKKLSLSEPKLRILNLNEISKFVGLTELSLTSCILNSGSLADLPTGLASLIWNNLSGLTVTGSLADLPTGLTSLYWGSMSGLTVTGSLADLPTGLTYLYWNNLSGLTVTGSLADLPTGLTYLYWNTLSGLTVTGSLADLPTGLASLIWNNLSGLTVTGSLADLPTGLASLIWNNLSGLTVTGSLADLPTGLASLNWSSMSGLTVTGSLADLPTGLASLNWSSMSGLTVTGTIDEFPVSINSTLTVQSCVNTNIGYTGGTIPAWGGVTITFQNAWTSTELDDFLIGWATTAGSGTKTIDLRGDNAARTSASDAAVSTLTGLGKTILTN